jgi:hypothetical protein
MLETSGPAKSRKGGMTLQRHLRDVNYSCLSLFVLNLVACTFEDGPLYGPPGFHDQQAPEASASEPVQAPIAITEAVQEPVAITASVPSASAAPPAVEAPARDDSDADAGTVDAAPTAESPLCQQDCTTFVDIATRLSLMVADLKALGPDAPPSDIRYLDLSHYANAGHGQRELDLYRDAVSLAMNTLSRSRAIKLPQAVDPQSLLFRIRLSDYGWTPDTWERLVASYPYAVTYDPNSRTFPIDDSPLKRLRDQTGTRTPFIQGDWFFSHAVRPPLYYDLLGVPTTLRQLELQLGVDIADDLVNRRVARAGFQSSGASHFNRVIERHSLGDDRGVLWLTHDFDAGTGFSNIITHPLDFRQTSSEILFSLANGLHGYVIVDAAGTRLDKAPSAAVQDARAGDLAIESGISCINCHAQVGTNVKHDELHELATLATTNLETANAILALYKDDATLDGLFSQDRARYQTAMSATRLHSFTEGSAHELDRAYASLLNSKQVAGVLGIEEQQLLSTINAFPGVFPPEVLALRIPGSVIPRDRFDALFAQLATTLGLGTPRGP